MRGTPLLRPAGYALYFARVLPPWVAIITLLCTLFQLADASALLFFDRQAIAAGEVWRLVSAHLLHLNTHHLVENIAALVLINLLVGENITSRRWLLASLFCALFVGLSLHLLAPHVTWYAGLSGVLHGLLVVGVVTAAIKRRNGVVYGVALGVITMKLFLEGLYGPLPAAGQMQDIPIVIESHRYGAIGGLVYALFVEWPLHRFTRQQRAVVPQ